MGAEWQEVTVEEIRSPSPNALATGPFGSSISTKFFTESGVPVIRGSNLSQEIGTRLIDEDIAFVSIEKAKEFSRSVARRGDLVFTCWGTIDQVGLIDNRSLYGEYIVSNKQMKLTPDREKADSLFLYYLFSSPQMKSQILNIGIGSSVPGFNLGQLRNLRILLPPLETQRAIAHILGTLDDKIELNRRTNQTLEAIAKALFKSWFVDFEPVRARAEGRQPEGMDAQTAALFPDGLEDSELGEIPRGWTVSQIGREVDVVGGSTPSTKEPSFWDGGIHWVTPKDLSALSDPILLDTERKITELGLVEIGSGLLPKGTVLMSSRAPIGYLAVSQIPVATNQGFISMKCTKQLSSWYVLHWAEHNMEAIKGRANGTTFLEVSKANFRILPIVVPSTKTLEAFEVFAGSLFARVIANLEESRTLATLRDSLLPKLLSGELGVDGILGKTEMKYEQSSNNQPTAH